MANWIFIILAGSLLPIQAVINGRLGTALKNPLLAALVSFIMGTIALVLAVGIQSRGFPKLATEGRVPLIFLTGGLIGAVFVTLVLQAVPRMGAANVLNAVIVGQLLMGVMMDHFGILGLPLHPISALRVCGVGLMVIAAWMIQHG
ncbi:DMT family transporter [Planctomicrobium sp. SH668]|uniref:DMT family transporter n=1 Tax=Planctomicrobium sp. SH668 TaxID=3448126 RepID=UPI003F5BE4B6